MKNKKVSKETVNKVMLNLYYVLENSIEFIDKDIEKDIKDLGDGNNHTYYLYYDLKEQNIYATKNFRKTDKYILIRKKDFNINNYSEEDFDNDIQEMIADFTTDLASSYLGRTEEKIRFDLEESVYLLEKENK